jgi:D-alanyl-D-alanine carboxypeptidase
LNRALGIPPDYGSSRGLPLQAEATALVSVGTNPDGRELALEPEAAASWTRMRDAATADGLTILAISGFRSVERQGEIIRVKLFRGEDIGAILRTIAAPGYSEHHTGRALDLGVPGEPALTEGFALTEAYAWLMLHGPEYGFRLTYPKGNPHGIAFEPWHWCYDGHL